MKPEYVKMQAFGPYLPATECDFTALYEARLFLITGPTGSGKTTILDAMSFALYGASTGELRSFRDMRSIGAPDELDTEVTFVFSLGEKRYRFFRGLHLHHKRTGGVDEQVGAECQVWENGEWQLLISGDTAVRKKASEILGFTHSQFSQVIVLPQGEFRRLLLAKSNEKLEILQVLFATSDWQRITQAAGNRLKQLRERLQTSRTQEETLLESAGVGTAGELEELLARQEAELGGAEKSAREAGEVLQKARAAAELARRTAEKFSSLQQTHAALTALKEQSEEMGRRKETLALGLKVKELLPCYRRFDAADREDRQKKQMAEAMAAQSDRDRKAFAAAVERAAAAPHLREEERVLRDRAAALSALLPDTGRLAGLIRSAKEWETALAAAESSVKNLRGEQEVLRGRIGKGERMVKELYETYVLPLPGLHRQLAEKETMLRDFAAAKAARAAAEQAASQQKEATAKEREAAEALRKAEEARAEAEEILRADAAYGLALHLQEGAPCPVCGAVHHPAPAILKAPAGGTDLEAAKSVEKAAREKASDALRRSSEASARFAAALDTLKAAEAQCAGYEEESAVQASRQALAAKIAEAGTAEEKYQVGAALLEDLKEKLTAAEAALREAEEKRSEAAENCSATAAKRDELAARLGAYADLDKLQEEYRQVVAAAEGKKSEAARLESEREAAELSAAKSEEAARGASAAALDAEQRMFDARRELELSAAAAGLPADSPFDEMALSDSEIADLEQELQRYDLSMKRISERAAELEEELRGTEPPDCRAADAAEREAESASAQLAELVGGLRSRTEGVKAALEKIMRLKAESADLEREYGKVCRVADFLAGGNPYKTPIHSFVLGLMLDEVVLAASRYLSELSRGRYQLIRVDATGGRSLRGLDIEVTDAHTGGQRKVCTLSGGELFLASLSLAFGLAEVVQSFAGGVKLDSIFIDEGFGTLDSETLEAAMKALSEIQKEGRLVGLISHVAELRSRIPARIEVFPGQDGSRLKVAAG